MRAEKARADAAGEPPQTHRRNRLGTPETPLSLEAQRELTGGDDIWQAAKCGRRVVVERLLDEGASVNSARQARHEISTQVPMAAMEDTLTEARAPRRRRVHGIAKCSGRD